MRWKPDEGHVPRGFIGAFGTLNEVEVVIVTAEPGEPLDDETQVIEHLSAEERVHHICRFTYDQLVGRVPHAHDYHPNMRYILDQIWPELPLDEQLTKTWIAESVLCSAPRSGGEVPQLIEATCRGSYLDQQLALLPGRLVVALGGKAKARLVGEYFASGYHPSATHGKTQKERAKESWRAAAKQIRAALEERARRIPGAEHGSE